MEPIKTPATIDFLANLSQIVFEDEIKIDERTIVTVKIRAPTIRDMEEVERLSGGGKVNPYKHAVHLIMRCLIEPKASQLDVENWNAGLIIALSKKIQSHANFSTDEIFLKDSLGAPVAKP